MVGNWIWTWMVLVGDHGNGMVKDGIVLVYVVLINVSADCGYGIDGW